MKLFSLKNRLHKALAVTATILTGLLGANLSALPANAAMAYSFDTWTFTPCGQTGRLGPTQAMCQTAYAGSSFASDTNYFTVDASGSQHWSPPTTGTYLIEVAGAGGGGSNGGKGQVLQTSVTISNLTTWLCMTVGQKGGTDTNFPDSGGGGGVSSLAAVTTSTGCGSQIFAGGGGGGGTVTSANADAGNAIMQVSPWTTTSPKPGTGTNAGQAKQSLADWSNLITGCSATGGPLTGGSNGTVCVAYGSNLPGNLPASANIAAAGKAAIGSSATGGTFGNGLGGDGGFPDGGASCGCYINGGGGGAGGGGGGGGGLNADGTSGVGGGGASSFSSSLGAEKTLLGPTNSGDGYIKITYDYASNTALTATSSVAGNPVGATITMGDPVFAQASGTPTYSYKWQTNSATNGMGTWTDIPGETGKVLTIPPSAAGLYVRGFTTITAPNGNTTYLATSNVGPIQYTHSFSNSSPPNGQVGSIYPFTFTLSGYNTTTSGWSLNSGALPPGVALGATTGALSGTATTAGTYTFSIKHTNPYGDAISPTYTVVINPANTVTFTNAAPPTALTNDNYSFQFAATSTTGETITYALGQGSFPGGLSIDPNTGVLSGYTTVTTAYTYTFKVRASIGATFDTLSPQYSITVGARTNSTSATFNQPAASTFNVTTPPTTSVAFTAATTGSGSYSYASTTPAICTVTSDGVTSPIAIQSIKPGTCSVTLIQAGTSTYNRWVNTVSWTIVKATQPASITISKTGSLTALGSGFTAYATGGSGTGAMTYAVQSGSQCVIDPITGVGQIWNPTSSGGQCIVQATRAADDYYQAQMTSITYGVSLASQTTPAVLSNVPASIAFSGALTLSASGGDFGLTFTGNKYVFSSTTASVCTVASYTGVITVKLAGTCTVNVYAVSNQPYLQGATSSNYSFQIVGDDQAPLTWSLTTTPARMGTSPVVSYTGGSGTGTYSWSTNSGASTVCTVTSNSSSGASSFGVTVLKAGTCVVDLNRAASGTYNPAYVAVTFTVEKAAQSTVTATFSPSTLTFNGTTPATTTITGAGGSGTGAYTYNVAASATAICSLSGNTVTALGAGSCVINVQRLGDSGYSDSAVLVKTLTISKSAQATVTISANRTTLLGSDTDPLVVTASGGSGTGAYAYSTSTSTVCAIDATTGVVTAKTLGTCTVTATRATDANYLVSSVSASISITISKMAQAAVSASSTVTSTSVGSATFTVTGSGGSGTGAFSYSSTNTSICTVVSSTGVTTVVGAGTCVITATKATDANYLAESASVSISIAKGNQAALNVTNGGTYAYGTTGINFSVTGGSGTGLLSYASSDTNVCTVAGTSVTTTGAGTCVITVTKAGDNNYFSTSGTVTFIITRANQATLTATAAPSSGTFGDGLSYSITASGGTGSGAITYSSNSTSICSVDESSGAITILTAGTCSITATKSGGAGYNDVAKTVTITVAKTTQSAVDVTASETAPAYVDSPKATIQVSYTGGSGTGAVSYSVSNPAVCSVDATGLVTDITRGKCIVTVTIASDTNYLVASGSVTIRFGFLDQASFNASSSSSSVVYGAGTAITVSTSGGSGTGTVSYSTGSSNCSVNANTGVVTYTTAGSCVIVATKAGDIDYASASASVTITVTQTSQSNIVLTLNKTTTTYGNGDSITASYTGGSGTGSATYTTSSSACSVDASTGAVTVLTAGTCVITVTIAADNNYTQASANKTLTIAKATQATFTASKSGDTTYGSSSVITVTSSGGTGTGSIRFASSTSSVCSVDSITGVLTIVTAGDCVITTTKDTDVNYLSASSSVTVTIAKAAQANFTSSKSGDTTYGSATVITVSTTGAQGTGSLSYASGNTGICTVNATTGVITIVSAGDCVVTATKATSTNYLVATSSVTISISKATQATSSATATFANVTFGDNSVNTAGLTGGSGTGAKTFSSTTPSVCAVNSTSGLITVVTAGNCTITATKAGDSNYNPTSANVSVTIAKANQAAFTVSSSTASITYGSAQTVTISSTGGSGTGTRTYSSNNPSVCSVDSSSGVLTVLTAGSCQIAVTKAADVNYNSISNTVSLNINKATQVSAIATPSSTSVTYNDGSTVTVSASGGSGTGAWTFASNSQSICSVNQVTGAVTILTAGTCSITATHAGDTNYNVATANTSITVAKAPQTPLSASGSTSLTHTTAHATSQISLTGGSGTGTNAYAVDASSSTICSVTAAGLVTELHAGTCLINISRAGDTNYLGTSTTFTVTIAKAEQNALNVTGTQTLTYSANPAATTQPSVTGGSTLAAVTYSESSAACSVSAAGVVTALAGGSCVLTVTRPGDTDYNAVSTTFTITVNKANQAVVIVRTAADLTYNADTPATTTISRTGGSGTGAVAFSTQSTSCSITGTTLTALSAGACVIDALVAADDQYNQASTSYTIVIDKAAQVALAASISESKLNFADPNQSTATVTVSGGSGTGAITMFVTGTQGVCSIDFSVSPAVLTALAAGTCVINVSKAADQNFLIASTAATILISKEAQSALQINANKTSGKKFDTVNLSATGGTTSGAITYSVVTGSSVCQVSGSVATFIGAGTCTVKATREGDLNYADVDSPTITLTGLKDDQSQLQVTQSAGLLPNVAIGGKSSTNWNIGGGNGDGALTVSKVNGCYATLDSNVLTASAGATPGECVIDLNKAGNENYNATTYRISLQVLELPSAAAIGTPTLNLSDGPNGVGVDVPFTPSSSGTNIAPVTGYQLQTKSGSNWINADNGFVQGAAANKISISVTPWTSIFVRVAAVSAYEKADASSRLWSTYGGSTAQAFSVPGIITSLSLSEVSAKSSETITVFGAGYSQAATPTVEFKAASPIFQINGVSTTTITLPASVKSSNQLTFKYPGALLPSGVKTLAATVRVNGTSSMKSNTAALTLTQEEETLDLGLDLGGGKFAPKVGTVYSGSFTWAFNTANGSKIFIVPTCAAYKTVNKVKTCTKTVMQDSASCTISQAFPLNKAAVRRMVTFKVPCQLNVTGKLAVLATTPIDIVAKATFNRTYPKTNLAYVLVKGKKTKPLLPTKATYIYLLGNKQLVKK